MRLCWPDLKSMYTPAMRNRWVSVRNCAAILAVAFTVAGCITVLGAAGMVALGDDIAAKVSETEFGPPDPPRIVKSTENSITVKYTAVGANPQHKEAEQLIAEHCGGLFKGERRAHNGWYIAEATCQ
jgi:hypothetical protein